jgi:hypothetical protein
MAENPKNISTALKTPLEPKFFGRKRGHVRVKEDVS